MNGMDNEPMMKQAEAVRAMIRRSTAAMHRTLALAEASREQRRRREAQWESRERESALRQVAASDRGNS